MNQHEGASLRQSMAMGLGTILVMFVVTLTAPVPAAAATVLRVGKAFPTAFGFVPLDVGIQEGIFKKYGLDIEPTSFGGAPMLIQALTAGSVDIGLDGGTDIAMIPRGLPGKGVAALANAPSEITIVVAPNSPIKTVADLKGKKIAVSQVGTLTGWLVSELSREEGWGTKGIALVTGSSGITALASHAADGFTIDLSSALQLQRQGRGRLLVKFGDYIKNFHAYVAIASDKLMADNPAALRSFLKAWFETIAFMRSHKAATVAIAAKVQHVDPDIASGTYDVMMKSFSTDGKFSAKALQVMARSFVELGLLPKAPDMDTLVTEKFLPQ